MHVVVFVALKWSHHQFFLNQFSTNQLAKYWIYGHEFQKPSASSFLSLLCGWVSLPCITAISLQSWGLSTRPPYVSVPPIPCPHPFCPCICTQICSWLLPVLLLFMPLAISSYNKLPWTGWNAFSPQFSVDRSFHKLTSTMSFTLPDPPSLNRCWKHGFYLRLSGGDTCLFKVKPRSLI